MTQHADQGGDERGTGPVTDGGADRPTAGRSGDAGPVGGPPDATGDAEGSADASVPWRSRTVQVVLLSTLVAPLGVPLVSPALPTIRDAFGLDDATASLLVSAYFLTGIVLSPFVGALADRLGRKRVLVASLLGFGVAGVATTLAPSFAAVLALRVIQGTAAAGVFVTTVTLVGDAFSGRQRNAVLGVTFATLSTGAAVFPVLGGALVAYGWSTPFYAYLAALPVALVVAVALDEPARTSRPVPGVEYLRNALRAVRPPAVLAMYAATFLAEFLLFGVVVTALPFVLDGEFGLAAVLVGVVIFAVEGVAIVVSAANGRLSARVDDRTLVAAGFVCYAAGCAVAALAPGVVVLVGGVALVGAGVGLVLPSVDAAVTGSVADDVRAGAVSLRNSTTFLGRAAGPIAFAAVGLAAGYDAAIGGAALLAAATAVGLLLVPGRRPRDRAAVEPVRSG